MVFVQPHAIGGGEVFLGERLREIGLRTEGAAISDHRTGRLRSPDNSIHIIVDELIRKHRIDVLIDHVQDDCYSCGVAGFDKSLQAVGAAETGVRSEIMEWTIAPVEIEFGGGDWHELQAVDTQALQITQSFNHAIKRVVELFHLQFVHDEIIQLRGFVGRIRPSERGLGPG